ncbi:hypothetical protein [Marinospirillum sp.]|uniref:hypothetical protein n=1 Tax=Marinospirillum sp. TaxID=2183934 RepID=UPI003851750A
MISQKLRTDPSATSLSVSPLEAIFDIRKGEVAGLKWSSISSLDSSGDLASDQFWQVIEMTLASFASDLSGESFQFHLPTELLVDHPSFLDDLQRFTEKTGLAPESLVLGVPSYFSCSSDLHRYLLPTLSYQGYSVIWTLESEHTAQSFNPFVSHIRVDLNQLTNSGFSLGFDLKKFVSTSKKSGKHVVFEQVNNPQLLSAIESAGGHLIQGRYLSRPLAVDQVMEAHSLAHLLANHF